MNNNNPVYSTPISLPTAESDEKVTLGVFRKIGSRSVSTVMVRYETDRELVVDDLLVSVPAFCQDGKCVQDVTVTQWESESWTVSVPTQCTSGSKYRAPTTSSRSPTSSPAPRTPATTSSTP